MPHSRKPLIGQYGSGRAGKALRAGRRYPAPYAPNRSTTAGFHDPQGQQLASFLAGDWVTTPVSTRVHAARWIEEVGNLEVQFVDGTYWWYPCDYNEAIAFAEAGSKGGFIWDHYDSRGIKGGPI